ncbi:UPF0481 protein At3g47200-like [Magnolia sinica]|uniref:UPF0481 protein At3g47200-like n=1 Tax=Magnolia sinica TaxID=86752 RepID=UPI00265851A2|nr:UPF0481 protein At3g47200-like [Magnolia sinica]
MVALFPALDRTVQWAVGRGEISMWDSNWSGLGQLGTLPSLSIPVDLSSLQVSDFIGGDGLLPNVPLELSAWVSAHITQGRFYTEIEEHPTEDISQNNEEISSTAPTNWVISIQQELDRLPRLKKEVWCSYSIFRAPETLKEMDQTAYRPKIISIGPIHRSRWPLASMEAHKWRFLGRCLDRSGHDMEFFINAIWPLVDRARRCYAEPTDRINDQDFIKMLLLDSCFILELLYAVAQGFKRKDDPLFSVRAAVLQIRSDMLLLENQIPLFVLERIFEITAGQEYRGNSVSQLALCFFSWIVPGIIKIQETPNTGNKDEEGLHLLNVLRKSLITLQSTRPTSASSSSRPLDKLPDSYPRPDLMMRCVSSLRDSGVKFEKRTSSKLTDIKFERGVLKIPPLLVDDTTKSIFLNLMAFEQCHPQCSDQISAYIVFMDGLINTKRDVAYLQQKGIINHQLGSEEAVAQLFNDLSRGISIDHRDGCHIYALSSELNEYVSLKWPTWRASLKREYFRHPWSTLSIVAAVLIIGLTLTETLYSILAYHINRS